MAKQPPHIQDPNQGEVVGSGDTGLSAERAAVLENLTGGGPRKYARLAMAALGGIPWVGSIISAMAAMSSEEDQQESNELLFLWISEHEEQLRFLGKSLQDVFRRFESLGEQIEERIASDEYLTLVRKTFRLWDASETLEKKEMFKQLITNAGALTMADDDLVRLFLDWIDRYHEFHFMVIRQIYKQAGITRRQMWLNVKGSIPRDDSPEADLFKLLIRDLSTGDVIRQEREVDHQGRYKTAPKSSRGSSSSTMISAFENTKGYVLTDLGKRFVHYVMTDVVQQIGQ